MHIPVNVTIPHLWGDGVFEKNEWDPINYLVGSNGTGKSTFVEHLQKTLLSKGVVRYLTSDRLVDWTKPNLPPYRIILGSMIDKNSRIMKIWRATLKVSKINKGESFIRKWVENIEQKACGNNRLPSRSAFHIFVHLKWLEITGRKGNVIYYKVTKKDDA